MKAYRIVVKIEDPINHMEFQSPRVFLFLPFKCAYKYEQEYLGHCRLLFQTEHNTSESEMNVDYRYKEFEIHPVRDLLSRIWCLLKYRM